jgi:hypothetical protein
MSTSKKILASAAGLALAAGAAAYGVRWRRNYRAVMWERDVRSEIPEDIVGGLDITMDEIGEFEGLVDFTCMEPCCLDFDADEYDFDYPKPDSDEV